MFFIFRQKVRDSNVIKEMTIEQSSSYERLDAVTMHEWNEKNRWHMELNVCKNEKAGKKKAHT
jgi:hypothetical protein